MDVAPVRRKAGRSKGARARMTLAAVSFAVGAFASVVAALAHRDWQKGPGGVFEPETMLRVRNVGFGLGVIGLCVGTALKLGGF